MNTLYKIRRQFGLRDAARLTITTYTENSVLLHHGGGTADDLGRPVAPLLQVQVGAQLYMHKLYIGYGA